jgi:hypothetical protein
LAESFGQPSGSVVTWTVSSEFGGLPAGYTLQSSGTLTVQAGSGALNGTTVVYLTRNDSWNGGPSIQSGYARVNVTVSGGVWLNNVITSMTPEQIGAIPVSQLGMVDSWKLGTLTVVQIGGLKAEQIRALSPMQFSGLSAVQLGALSEQQKQGVTYSQRAMLSADKLAALGSGSTLTDAQLVALTPEQVSALTLEQLSGLSADQLALLSVEQLSALSYWQIRALTPERNTVLSAAQLAALEKPFTEEGVNAVMVSVAASGKDGDVGLLDLTKALQAGTSSYGMGGPSSWAWRFLEGQQIPGWLQLGSSGLLRAAAPAGRVHVVHRLVRHR